MNWSSNTLQAMGDCALRSTCSSNTYCVCVLFFSFKSAKRCFVIRIIYSIFDDVPDSWCWKVWLLRPSSNNASLFFFLMQFNVHAETALEFMILVFVGLVSLWLRTRLGGVKSNSDNTFPTKQGRQELNCRLMYWHTITGKIVAFCSYCISYFFAKRANHRSWLLKLKWLFTRTWSFN